MSARATMVLLLPFIVPAALGAQVKSSERASVSQTVDGTVIQVDYGRPQARGRDPLFGGVVEWGRVWTAGANQATVLDLSRDVTIHGVPVAAGKWSVWFVVRQEGPWELILDPRSDLWHTEHPAPSSDQVRVPVQPDSSDHTEALTWSFPAVRRNGTTLALAWGTMRVSLEIEIEPTVRLAVTQEEARPYVGHWEMERRQESGAGLVRQLEILHADDGSLRAIIAATAEHERREWVLQPRADRIFAIGVMRDGAPHFGADLVLEMTGGAERATDFVVRDGDDAVTYVGRRTR